MAAQIRLPSARSLASTERRRRVVRNDNLGITNTRPNVVIVGDEVQGESGYLSRNVQ